MSLEPRPRLSLTPEEIVQIDAALTATKGVRADAAVALGMHPDRVYYAIESVPSLHAKWSNKPKLPVEPTPAADLHRPAPPAPFTAGEKDIVVAITKEDAVLQKGWKRLGFGDKERKFLAGLQASYAGNLKGTLDLAYGGAAHANTRLLLALEQVKEKIEDITKNPEGYHRSYMTEHGERVTKGPDEYLKEFYDIFIKISGELRKMSDSVTKANELRLKMEKLRLAQQEKQRTEAGWDVARPVTKVEAPS